MSPWQSRPELGELELLLKALEEIQDLRLDLHVQR
jgi:hypothetical protein